MKSFGGVNATSGLPNTIQMQATISAGTILMNMSVVQGILRNTYVNKIYMMSAANTLLQVRAQNLVSFFFL